MPTQPGHLSGTAQHALLFCYTESSLHAGTGSAVSAIDLPIQRERITNFPIVQGSGIKGALRSEATDRGGDGSGPIIEAIFGPETQNSTKYAGAVSFSEARVILFPVRSLKNTFAYVTCPQVIARLVRDARQAGAVTEEDAQQWSTLKVNDATALVATEPTEKKANLVIDGTSVMLEEFVFAAEYSRPLATLAAWLAQHAFPATAEYAYWRAAINGRLVLVSDTTFADFVTNSTEISTHVKLAPESKTVESGALWTSESLPAETLLAVLVTARSIRMPRKDQPAALGQGTGGEALTWLRGVFSAHSRAQLGGDETSGQGVVALTWQPEA